MYGTGVTCPITIKMQCGGCNEQIEIGVAWEPFVEIVRYCKSCNHSLDIRLDLRSLKDYCG
jgi:hypothetical protein